LSKNKPFSYKIYKLYFLPTSAIPIYSMITTIANNNLWYIPTRPTRLLLAHPKVGLQSRCVVLIRIRLDEYNIMQETVRYIILKQTHKSYFLGLKNKTYRNLWPSNEICNDDQNVSEKLFSDMYGYNFLFFSWLYKAKIYKLFYNFVLICSTKNIFYFYKLEINSHFFVFLEKCTHSLLKYPYICIG